MNLLQKQQYYINLYDFYGDLLTEKQQIYFKDYYFDDLSLAEIAINHEVSRNAVYDSISKVYKLLENYEKKLGLLDKFQKREKLFAEYKNFNEDKINEIINKLQNIE
ncbi:MAG TPA: hypothetical protein GX695_05845 [Acholeplasmataceae bacterium]|nr:hypothetical protein [Acholeplasmataceae bacterium]